MTNLLVWANKRMGLASGMCGHPKEGGDKNSARIYWIPVSTRTVCGGRQTGRGCGPTWLTLAGCRQSFPDWKQESKPPMTSGGEHNLGSHGTLRSHGTLWMAQPLCASVSSSANEIMHMLVWGWQGLRNVNALRTRPGTESSLHVVATIIFVCPN